MLALSKKTDYALISLAYLAEQAGRVASAREIGEGFNIPVAVVANILKCLQKKKILQSTRGVNGGYRVATDLAAVSLFELIAIVDQSDENCECAYDLETASMQVGPVAALHFQLTRFLRDVKVSDLVLPGIRIDVPVERVKSTRRLPTQLVLAD